MLKKSVVSALYKAILGVRYLFSIHMCIFYLTFMHNIVIPGYKDITLHIFFLVLFGNQRCFPVYGLSGICMDRPRTPQDTRGHHRTPKMYM